MNLASANQDMLARLLHFGFEEQVALVHPTDRIDHLGQLAGDEGLDCYFYNGLGPEF